LAQFSIEKYVGLKLTGTYDE